MPLNISKKKFFLVFLSKNGSLPGYILVTDDKGHYIPFHRHFVEAVPYHFFKNGKYIKDKNTIRNAQWTVREEVNRITVQINFLLEKGNILYAIEKSIFDKIPVSFSTVDFLKEKVSEDLLILYEFNISHVKETLMNEKNEQRLQILRTSYNALNKFYMQISPLTNEELCLIKNYKFSLLIKRRKPKYNMMWNKDYKNKIIDLIVQLYESKHKKIFFVRSVDESMIPEDESLFAFLKSVVGTKDLDVIERKIIEYYSAREGEDFYLNELKKHNSEVLNVPPKPDEIIYRVRGFYNGKEYMYIKRKNVKANVSIVNKNLIFVKDYALLHLYGNSFGVLYKSDIIYIGSGVKEQIER